MHNDGITDISLMQNASLIVFNGADDIVGEDDNVHHEEGHGLTRSYSEMVLGRFSSEQVKEVVSVLVEYIQDEVPVERWAEQTPERTVPLIKGMLKNRDNFVAEGVRAVRLTLDQEYNRSLSLSRRLSTRRRPRDWLRRGSNWRLRRSSLLKRSWSYSSNR